MAADAALVVQREDVVLGQAQQTIVQLAPMKPGRSFVVWAKGQLLATNSISTLVLEAFDGKHFAEVGFSGNQGQALFSLIVATTLPADDDLFTVAKLSGTSRPFVGAPQSGLALVRYAELVVPAVNTLQVLQG